MANSKRKHKSEICFKLDDFYGSRYRCLLMTHLGKEKLYEQLNRLCHLTDVKISFDKEKDNYLPYGFCKPSEQILTNLKDKTIGTILTEKIQTALWSWWLKEGNRGTKTPTWDLISTCTINDCPGLLLVEAKAHFGENSAAGKTKDNGTNIANHNNILHQIDLARTELEKLTNLAWGIQADSFYQLSNRFTWAWKLASLGVPVVLLYLGFINAVDEKFKAEDVYRTESDFINEFKSGEVARIVPPDVWDKSWMIKHKSGESTPFIPLLKTMSCEVDLSAK